MSGPTAWTFLRRALSRNRFATRESSRGRVHGVAVDTRLHRLDALTQASSVFWQLVLITLWQNQNDASLTTTAVACARARMVSATDNPTSASPDGASFGTPSTFNLLSGPLRDDIDSLWLLQNVRQANLAGRSGGEKGA